MQRTSSRSLSVSNAWISSSRDWRFCAFTGGRLRRDGRDTVGDIDAKCFVRHGDSELSGLRPSVGTSFGARAAEIAAGHGLAVDSSAAVPSSATAPFSRMYPYEACRKASATLCSTTRIGELLLAVDAAPEFRRSRATISGRKTQRGLVDQQEPGIADQRAADGQHLLLAARQQPGVGFAAVRKLRKIGIDIVEAGRRAPPAPRQREGRGGEIFLQRHVGEHVPPSRTCSSPRRAS